MVGIMQIFMHEFKSAAIFGICSGVRRKGSGHRRDIFGKCSERVGTSSEFNSCSGPCQTCSGDRGLSEIEKCNSYYVVWLKIKVTLYMCLESKWVTCGKEFLSPSLRMQKRSTHAQ